MRADGVFHIATPAAGADDASPANALFPQRRNVPLAQVLETVNNHCGMLQSFEHWQQAHILQAVSRPALLAGIMGLGCGIGVRKTARISSRVTEGELEHVVNWRFSLDNTARLDILDSAETDERGRQLISVTFSLSDHNHQAADRIDVYLTTRLYAAAL